MTTGATVRVAVLGAGIMGSCLSLYLSRLGAEVTLVDREASPMAATSRWNEGKIHLGYLYGADPSLSTARHLLPGGLAFGRLMSNLLGQDVREHATTHDDLYLVHRDSVTDVDAMRRTFHAVSELVRSHGDAAGYLVDASAARAVELPVDDCGVAVSQDILAAFSVPERSVNTRWVADQLAAAVLSDGRISVAMGTTVTTAHVAGPDGRPSIATDRGEVDGSFDVVVNALWDGRLAVDATAGVVPDHTWTHRYRLCAFVRTSRPVSHPSAVVSVGPFGDVKNYDEHDFYLSWYPVGLLAESSDLTLPAPARPEGVELAAFVAALRAGLEACLPGVGGILDNAERLEVGGGFVYAQGTGSIGDRRSGLHRRDRYGVDRLGDYFSVDTGKYSTAPWSAKALADAIMSNR